MSRPFIWGVAVGAFAAWFLGRRCPNCGARTWGGVDPGAILAHGRQAST